VFDREVVRKLDTNGLFMVGEDVFKIEYPLREDKVTALTKKLVSLRETYMKDMEVHYTIVPDKNYFLPNDGQFLILDYERMRALMADGMTNMEYIDLFDTLSLDAYYYTDGHWRQERLGNVLAVLSDGMGFDFPATIGGHSTKSSMIELNGYERQSYDRFYGAYYGQSARQLTPDVLVWLENETTRNAIVTDPTQPNLGNLPVYRPEGLEGMDAYDLYLHGAQPLLVLENPNATVEKELLLFRDSYGSSLAPLMLESYSKITLIDLRYIQPQLLGQFIEFGGQDVLFMYSATIINNSDIIR